MCKEEISDIGPLVVQSGLRNLRWRTSMSHPCDSLSRKAFEKRLVEHMTLSKSDQRCRVEYEWEFLWALWGYASPCRLIPVASRIG